MSHTPSRPGPTARPSSYCMAGPMTFTFCRRDADTGVGGLPCGGALLAWLRGNELRPARRSATASHRRWRLIPWLSWMLSRSKTAVVGGSMGGAPRPHHGGPLAQPREGDGVGQRLSDRHQEAGRMPLRRGRAGVVVPVLFARSGGRIGYEKNRTNFAKLLWRTASQMELR